MDRIGVEPCGNSTPPERVQTSLWCERTGEDSQPALGSNAAMSAGPQRSLLVRLPPPKHFGSRLCSRTVQVALKANEVHRVLRGALFHA